MTGCVRFKPGVDLRGLAPAGARLLAAVDFVAQAMGRDLTVTCGTDSHGADDPHTRGAALDVRVADLSDDQTLVAYDNLRKLLGHEFTVLYEVPEKPAGLLAGIAYVNPAASGPHFHLQVRKGYRGAWPDGEVTT